MATPFFYSLPADNVAPLATASVETGTPATGYEAAYLTDLADANRQRPAKLTGTTGAWLLDFGAAQRLDLFVLWHNFDAALANVKIQGNATNSWGGPTLSATVVPPAKRGDGSTVKIFQDLRSVSGYSASGFRYWRIVSSTANSVNLGLKVWAAASIRQLSRNVQWGIQEPEDRPGIVLGTDFDASAWTYDLQVGPRKFLAKVAGRDTDRELVRTWFAACGGRAKVCLIVPSPDDATQGAWLVRWLGSGDGLVTTTLDTTLGWLNYNPQTLSFEEVTAGGPEWT